jgi:class I fructose-bisphosphate aldolase
MAIANRSAAEWLGSEAELLLQGTPRVSRERLHLPGPAVVDRFALTDRNPQVMRSLQQLYGSGRLANTGY